EAVLHPAAMGVDVVTNPAADAAQLLQPPPAAAFVRCDQVQKALRLGQGLRPLLQQPDLKRPQFSHQPPRTYGSLQPFVIPLTEQAASRLHRPLLSHVAPQRRSVGRLQSPRRRKKMS